MGAGLAGCALAEAFSRRGWRVDVFDSRDYAGGAVASLPLIAQHPSLSPDNDLRSRLLIRAMQLHDGLRQGAAADLQPAFEVCGRLLPMEAERIRRCMANIDAASAGAVQAHEDGLWFGQSAALSPRRWWQQVMRRPELRWHPATTVVRLERIDTTPARNGFPEPSLPAAPVPDDGPDPAKVSMPSDRRLPREKAAHFSEGATGSAIPAASWRLLDEAGQPLVEAEIVALACREQAFALAGMQAEDHGVLRLSATRMWTARADGGAPDEDPGFPALQPICSAHGLSMERPGSFWLHNEDFHQRWLEGLTNAQASHAADTASIEDFINRPESWHPGAIGERLRLRDNLPMAGPAPDVQAIAQQQEALARNDRLPIPRQPGLYLLTGLAGRGSLYAVIGAEIIAADAAGEPPVVEAALTRAIDPARFIKRRLQRAWSQRQG